jgi:hypothetical protein
MPRARPEPFSKVDALIRELLDWAALRPRTYGEAMDAWSTHCPGQPIWEDAIDAGLIEVLPASGRRAADRAVRVTETGRAFRDAA